MTARVAAVTGAGGFIGRHLCERLSREGWSVRALVRDPRRHFEATHSCSTFLCDLPDRIDEASLAGVEALVHCSWVTRHTSLDEARRVNEIGSRRLFDAARRAGVGRVVFVSSQSAHTGAVSYYGRSKKAIEESLDPGRDLIIRPGLVLGEGSAGLFARMCETVERTRVIPLFGGGRQPLQTVHIEDLCRAIASAMDRGLSGSYTIAESNSVMMGDFMRMVARRLGKRPLFVPCPIAPALLALRVIETLGLPFPVSSENLLGLRQMRAAETAPDLAALGVTVRSASESLHDLLGRKGG